MYNSHYQYLEDIVVRVLCTLALDQLSDFISDEVSYVVYSVLIVHLFLMITYYSPLIVLVLHIY